MKVRPLVLSVLLTVGLVVPANATGTTPVSPRPVCVLDDCHWASEFYTIAVTPGTGSDSGLQQVATATDGKVWFSGGVAGTGEAYVGYIKPWDKDSGTHLCAHPLTYDGSRFISVWSLVPGEAGSMDVVGFNGGVVHYNADCTTATYPSVQAASGVNVAARDADGHIWASNTGSSNVVDLNSNTRTQSNWVSGLTSGPDGRMWATDGVANEVLTWDNNDVTSNYQATPLNSCVPAAIASDRQRYLWISCSNSDAIVRVDTDLGSYRQLTYFNVPTYGGLGLPGITVANDGNVWLTDQGDQMIRAFDPSSLGNSGGQINFFVYGIRPYEHQSQPLLRDITTDLDNNAWYLNAADSTINFIGVNPVGPNPDEKEQTSSSCTSSSKWTVYFKERSAKLTGATKATLDCIATKVGKAKSVKIYGYTMTNKKSPASKMANKLLAKRRAHAVRTYLRSHGVKAKITVVAKGAVNPASATKQSKNRRVVIIPKYLALFD